VRRRQANCALLVLVVGLWSYLWASQKFPEYPIRQATAYAINAQKAEIAIGLEPVEDIKEQQTYFREKLAQKGFLPVFVVVENKSATERFILDMSNLEFSAASHALVKLTSINTYLNKTEDNIMAKELRSRTLSPGESTHGFVYIPIPKGGQREKINLQIPITKAGVSETFVLNFSF
jgi:hypothetical protein